MFFDQELGFHFTVNHGQNNLPFNGNALTLGFWWMVMVMVVVVAMVVVVMMVVVFVGVGVMMMVVVVGMWGGKGVLAVMG